MFAGIFADSDVNIQEPHQIFYRHGFSAADRQLIAGRQKACRDADSRHIIAPESVVTHIVLFIDGSDYHLSAAVVGILDISGSVDVSVRLLNRVLCDLRERTEPVGAPDIRLCKIRQRLQCGIDARSRQVADQSLIFAYGPYLRTIDRNLIGRHAIGETFKERQLIRRLHLFLHQHICHHDERHLCQIF